MKIAVLDAYTTHATDLNWNWLAHYGQYDVFDRTDVDNTQEIIDRIGEAEIAITNKTPIGEEVMSACANLKLVCVLATGYNIIDLQAARKNNVIICNVPAYSTMSTSQYAIALLLELTNHIGLHNEAVHNGEWENSKDFCFWKEPIIELSDKTMGIIGLGAIGSQTAKTAKALGMNVVVYTPHPKEDWKGFVDFIDLDELFSRSDVIVLHCVLNDDTKEIINAQSIAQMKDGVLIINNGRGPLINEVDLATALNDGKVAGAAVDVVSTEPITSNNPLLKAKNCIITPHISWTSKECRERIMQITEENIKSYISGKPINTV